MAGKDSKI